MALGHELVTTAIAYCCCLPNHSIKIKMKINKYKGLVKRVCFIKRDGFEKKELEKISEIYDRACVRFSALKNTQAKTVRLKVIPI